MLPSCLLFEAVNNNNSAIHFVGVMPYLTEENKLHLPKYNVLVTKLPPG
jgi:hypothetical protein